MAILCFLGMWALYIWLVQKCVLGSVAAIGAKDRNDFGARGGLLHVEIPDSVPSEWIEGYRAENDA